MSKLKTPPDGMVTTTTEDPPLTAELEPSPNGNIEGMDFDLEPIVIPVRIKDKKGTIHHYELREASGGDACRWRNSLLNKAKIGSDGKPTSFGNIADTEPILVALCLYPEGSNERVSVDKVRSWPSRIQKALFAKAKEISDLDDDEEDKELAKNEPEDMQDGL